MPSEEKLGSVPLILLDSSRASTIKTPASEHLHSWSSGLFLRTSKYRSLNYDLFFRKERIVLNEVLHEPLCVSHVLLDCVMIHIIIKPSSNRIVPGSRWWWQLTRCCPKVIGSQGLLGAESLPLLTAGLHNSGSSLRHWMCLVDLGFCPQLPAYTAFSMNLCIPESVNKTFLHGLAFEWAANKLFTVWVIILI